MNELREQYKTLFGKYPHGQMSEEKIQAKIEEATKLNTDDYGKFEVETDTTKSAKEEMICYLEMGRDLMVDLIKKDGYNRHRYMSVDKALRTELLRHR